MNFRIILLGLSVLTFSAISWGAPMSGTIIGSTEAILVSGPTFDAAWQNYLFAFQPVRDALMEGDFKTAKNYLEKLKETAQGLREAEIPDQARKPVKIVLKYNKQLLEAAAHGDREEVKVNLNHLKDAIGKVEEARVNRHQ